MGYQDNGYYQQNPFGYLSVSESRPENPPALVGGTIFMTDENDEPLYLQSDFVKSAPANDTWALGIVDSQGNSLKAIANSMSGLPGSGDTLTFDYQNDYPNAVSVYADATLSELPVVQSFDAFLESTDESTGKTRRVPVRIEAVETCIEAFTFEPYIVSEGSETYPFVADIDTFTPATGGGGFTWELSLTGTDGWGETVTIEEEPENLQQILVYFRATGPCPTSQELYQTEFERNDPI